MTPRILAFALALLFGNGTAAAQPFSAQRVVEKGVPIIRLINHGQDIVISIAPTVGNVAYEMKVKGENILWFPYESVAEFAANPRLCGIPFLWPWANRLDEDGFYFDGRRYALNPDLGGFSRDGNGLPIHGLLKFSPHWDVVSLQAGDHSAEVVSKLEFHRHPALIAQFPFAHSVQMTYRLGQVSQLRVDVKITNEGREPLPISMGFHPYFQVHDAPRDDWTVTLPVEKIWLLDEKLTPTGETVPAADQFESLEDLPLRGLSLDHVFGFGEFQSRRTFVVKGKQQQVGVDFSSGYDAAVVYAPQGGRGSYVCFEPMAGVTNAYNLAHRGQYSPLQSVLPGQSWRAVFTVTPSGF